jgi:RNA polymerase sigma factor (sigma-70 family)
MSLGAKVATNLTQHDYHCAFAELFGDDTDEYMRVWKQLVRFFLKKRPGDIDAEDLAHKVMDRLFAKVLDGTEIANVTAYSLGVARNVYREQLRKRVVHPFVSLTEYSDGSADDTGPFTKLWQTPQQQEWIEHLEDTERNVDVWLDCLRDLKLRDQKLLIRYYKTPDREKLASEMNMSSNHLRVYVHRLKARLRHSYQQRVAVAKRVAA